MHLSGALFQSAGEILEFQCLNMGNVAHACALDLSLEVIYQPLYALQSPKCAGSSSRHTVEVTVLDRKAVRPIELVVMHVGRVRVTQGARYESQQR